MSIHIPNWDDFQHADVTKRGNAPAWIKNYTRLLSDDNYLDLTPEQRALLHGIWIEYARSGKKLSETTSKLGRKLNMRVTKPMLAALNQAGFIEIRQDAVTTLSSLEEKRREEREEKESSTKAVLTALPGGGQPDETDSLGNTFENILKEIV